MVSTSSNSRAAVVYFSRSGNTALAARRVAQRLDAQLFAQEASDQQLGMRGLVHAVMDANMERCCEPVTDFLQTKEIL